jgi:uncharacterized SAM-binding protein YcdF (DUF218 family)
MELYFQKVLTALIMPLGLTTALLMLIVVRRLFGWARGDTTLLSASLAILWIAASPWGAITLMASLESRHPPLTIADVPRSDVIVVLGGVVEPASAPRIMPQLSEGVNRLTYAAKLYAAGKAPEILLSGGRMDGSNDDPAEAEIMADVLTWLGVPRSAIVLETQSRTTHENAQRTAEEWRRRGYRSGVLVTSAFHMKRADREFHCAGLALTLASADVRISRTQDAYILQWFPNAVMAGWTTLAIKEYVGLAVAALLPCRPGFHGDLGLETQK